MKKASIITSVVIVLAISMATILIATTVASEVFGGISAFSATKNPCKSLNALEERIEIACKYKYSMRTQLSIPTRVNSYVIQVFPGPSDSSQLTGYNPYMNRNYPECQGGVCLCMVSQRLNTTPGRTDHCSFCYPIARQEYEPAFRCLFGNCRFDNIGSIPRVNSKFVNTSTGTGSKEVRIFRGLRFNLPGKTNDLSWLEDYCTYLYDGGGVFISDRIESGNVTSGACFKQDRLVSTCINTKIEAKNNPQLKHFVNLTGTNWPLKETVSLNITYDYPGIIINKSEFGLWWTID